MLYHCLFFLVAYSMFNIRPTNGWNVPSSSQYHIQTDEGPERYFRYQTDSGQYRKEKRLEDGTVVGTYAWIDDNGILQKRDYMADNTGYRILKTTNIFVGKNVPIGQAMKSIAKYHGSAGILVNSSQQPVITIPYNTDTSHAPDSQPVTNKAERPYEDTLSNSLLSASLNVIQSTEPSVVTITPKSVYSTSTHPLLLPPKSTSQLPPYYQSTTPRPAEPPTIKYISSSQNPYELKPQLYDNNKEVSKEVKHNSLEYLNQIDNSYRFHNGPTYPLDQNGKPYFGQNLKNEYDPQYSTYDGISVTNDGFRYYIPRAYHEEETLPGDKRSGSFGYIDPFGIRRVIYYNTAPGSGFQHRKNNRYVGFQATPYDPRPY
ncbi:uncharacterized protein LOC108913562 isoform X2 [Anoplophora glabripennis]|uniref:uncharacterized protein LOC108913562 isoform X2 n=1 Tax=Anoplophora glabripennis TaxID=217634 RepID=UPI00087535F8|nr:uncharacterized protein LOC108913562 isoform X2 [Anoplophora glabripennis]